MKSISLTILFLISAYKIQAQNNALGNPTETINFRPNTLIFKKGVVINGVVSYDLLIKNDPQRSLKKEVEKLKLKLDQLKQIEKLKLEIEALNGELETFSQAQQSQPQEQEAQEQQEENTRDYIVPEWRPSYNKFELRILGGTSFHSDFTSDSQKDLKTFLLNPYTGTAFLGIDLSWLPTGKWLKLNLDSYYSYYEGDITIDQESSSMNQSYIHIRPGFELIPPIRSSEIERISVFFNFNYWKNGESDFENTQITTLNSEVFLDFGFKLSGKLGERSIVTLNPNFILVSEALDDHFDSKFIETITLNLKIPLSK